MSGMNIETSILAEVGHLDGKQTVERLKHIVCDEISGMDHTAVIRTTRFFNHTYGPDMVVTWPDAKDAERYVYLRTTPDENALKADLATLSDFKPLMVTITDDEQHEDNNSDIPDASTRNDTFVGTLNAVHCFNEKSKDNPIDGLFSKMLVKGGRGLYDTERKVNDSVTSFSNGLQAAKEGDQKQMSDSLDSTSQALEASTFSQLDIFYQAIWRGSQRRLDTYPRDVHVTGELDDDSWNFLLATEEIDDDEFWRSLGSALKLEQIVHLDSGVNPSNFSHLMDAKASTVRVKSLMVSRYQQPLNADIPSDAWQWAIVDDGNSRHLNLHDSSLSVYFSAASDIESDVHLEDATRIQRKGISLKAFRERVQGIKVNEVGIQASEKVQVSAFSDGNVSDSETLGKLAQIGTVTSAVIQLPSEQSANLRFDICKATASTNAKPSLPDLALGSVPVLEKLSTRQKSLLQERFHENHEPETLQLAFDFE